MRVGPGQVFKIAQEHQKKPTFCGVRIAFLSPESSVDVGRIKKMKGFDLRKLLRDATMALILALKSRS